MNISRATRKKKRRPLRSGASLSQAPKLKATDPQVIELWARAGGRCEFHGCNEYLLQDKLTTCKAKLADIAHIVARSKDGARGEDPMPMSQRNGIHNLLLACTTHHRLIDNRALVKKYPKDLLVGYKQAHEERIRYVTDLGPESETVVVRLLGNIRGNSVSVSDEAIRGAVLQSLNRYPRYLGGEHHIEIDLTNLPRNVAHRYWSGGVELINDVVDRMLVPGIEKGEIRHLSVFAFASIPFLAYFGHAIGDKIPLEIFQKHRNGDEGWVWPADGEPSRFSYKKVQDGSDETLVAVTLSLSGQISNEQLPNGLLQGFTIYSIMPVGTAPNRTILSSRNSLEAFRRVYADLLRDIEQHHPHASVIHIFPAIPISGAIILGRELLRNVSPSVLIYDLGTSQFEPAVRIERSKQN